MLNFYLLFVNEITKSIVRFILVFYGRRIFDVIFFLYFFIFRLYYNFTILCVKLSDRNHGERPLLRSNLYIIISLFYRIFLLRYAGRYAYRNTTVTYVNCTRTDGNSSSQAIVFPIPQPRYPSNYAINICLRVTLANLSWRRAKRFE